MFGSLIFSWRIRIIKKALGINRPVSHHNIVILSQAMCPLPEQDLLNILFYFYPQRLYELGCQWNFRPVKVSRGWGEINLFS